MRLHSEIRIARLYEEAISKIDSRPSVAPLARRTRPRPVKRDGRRPFESAQGKRSELNGNVYLISGSIHVKSVRSDRRGRCEMPFLRWALVMFGVALTMLIPMATGHAQSVQGGFAQSLPSASAAAYYYVAKPGDLTMQVNVWGFVKNPGRYEVSSSTNIVQLLSYAGGSLQYAELTDVKVLRMISDSSGRTDTSMFEYSIDLDDIKSLTAAELGLLPGDTIFIDHTGWLTVRDVFSVITTAALITSAIAQVLIASSR